ncbi:acetyl-CoA carboxylase biotin carboxylase subunit family protein [Amycolatopsis sp. BJA-103]|uniref:ATP-grasp domain-containing protein n=1 Tax=Amycolatopsis sp. BJA-103 TaxID=1911175 RepID=UPI000C79108A|nr:ATP-grasp domain-containing protein [Amycolatopsis sp. BJA-103]AUI58168.1 biotin carboxylase [Amycolatopsis sp. BJA-103]PNE13200.1 biotin carboxylase [Amycolatopsis sp. BJA-103]
MTTSSRSPEEKNIFVLGLDDANEDVLRRIPGVARYRFHPLLSPEELQHGEIPIVESMDKAVSHLDAFTGPIDAIVGYGDFPSSTMVAMLCEKYGLPGVSLEAVLKCEHKYWSRLEQAKVIDEVPSFGIVDLDHEDPRPPDGVGYPLWLKPVKSFSSELAFHVADEDGFDKAVAEIRASVDRVGRSFDRVLGTIELPVEVAGTGGAACLAEGELSGVRAATEGYVHKGHITVYGALDSVDYPDSTCLLRHQYPSQLPEDAIERMKEISVRVMEQIGFDNATFGIEFFCHPESGQVCLLEITPRHSHSHAELFEYVDGVANHQIMVQLGLGQEPGARRNRGDYRIAGKWYHRRFRDGLVTRVPTRGEIAELEAEIRGVRIEVVPEKGVRLSELPAQDSHSYELAHIFVAAQTQREMESKYRKCTEALRFDFEEG